MAPDSIRVFCSHRQADKEAVRAFGTRLREAGIDAWLDDWEVLPGDDIVAKMNDGLAQCDVGLVFFSQHTSSGAWVGAEISALIQRAVEDGKRLIPVMLEADVVLPPLIRTRARRSIDEFDAILDAIHGRDRKPPLGAGRAQTVVHRFVVALAQPQPGRLDIRASLDGEPIAEASDVPIRSELAQSYADFITGHVKLSTRGPQQANRAALERALVDLGKHLAETVLVDDIGTKLHATATDLPPGEIIEVVFEADDGMLLALPYEALRLPNGEPLVALPNVTVVRRPVGESAPPPRTQAQQEAITLAGPLKILVAVGAPDEGKSKQTVLDLENELQGILDAVGHASKHGNAQVRILEVGHPEEIRKALARDGYHVLHLSGHGKPGAIVLETEDGEEHETSAETLAEVIKSAQRPLPLVVLSSCHGGTPGESDTVSLAQGLIRHGIPMVVSMQTRVTDAYASALSGEFYRQVSEPGDLAYASRALAGARRTLELERRRSADETLTQPEYATASLFVSGDEPPLLDHVLEKVELSQPPVHRIDGPVPQLEIGELVGRREELRRVLRALRLDESEGCLGVVLTGIGGVGKSAIAGRAMQRMAERGWLVAAIVGKYEIGAVAEAVGTALQGSDDERLVAVGSQLAHAEADDRRRLGLLHALLEQVQLLLVLDNFEDNLAPGGRAYEQPVVQTSIDDLLSHCKRGRLLVTCRYPVPGAETALERIPVGALSLAQSRKLFLRLPSLAGREVDDLVEVMRRIGGHPRMLEYLDGILRRGRTRLATLRTKLHEAAERLDIELSEESASLDDAMDDALRLGADDIMLETLLSIADESGDTEALFQTAVSNIPIEVAGVAHGVSDGEVEQGLVAAIAQSLERLTDLSLVSPVAPGVFWVHRWTAEDLERRSDPATHATRCLRAARFRLDRVQSFGNLDDGIEATRNFIEAGAHDEASRTGAGVLAAMKTMGQVAAIRGLGQEFLRAIPREAAGYTHLAREEADANALLSYTAESLSRHRECVDICEKRLEHEPDRADHQRDLSVSYERLGDLHRALGQGEQARRYYEQALAIAQRLAQAEPDRADYQRDLSVSYNKLGDLHRALGQGEQARRYYEQDLAIAQRLAQAEPDRADYAQDLAISWLRITNVDPARKREAIIAAAHALGPFLAQQRLDEQGKQIAAFIAQQLEELGIDLSDDGVSSE